MFPGYTVLPDGKKTKLGGSDWKASPSGDRKTGVVLMPQCSWKYVLVAIYQGLDIPWVPGCHML